MGNLIRIPLRILIFSISVFTVLRLIFWCIYPDYFVSLSLADVVTAFLVGLRFDSAITVVAVGLFSLLLILPFNFKMRAISVQVLLWLSFAFLVVLWAINLGDMLYFGEVYRHAGRELLLLTQDLGMLVDLALTSRLLVFLLALPSILLLAWLWQKWVVVPSMTKLKGGFPIRALGSVLALVLLVFSARGGLLSGKPLSLVDAHAAGNEQQAALALNGAFAVIHGLRRALNDEHTSLDFFSPNALAENTLKYAAAQDPFLQRFGALATPRIKTDKNVVVILLESWSTEYIDGLSGGDYGVTPNMDKLINQSRVWENAYAAGQRSIEGIQAVLTSVPLLESQPVVGWGLEQNRMTRLASLLGERGYESVMMQSSNRRSFHMDGIAAAMGFDEYFGKEDLPLRLEYPVKVPAFGWDYEVLMHLADYLDNTPEQKPFFAFLFTGTTHEPFPDPGAKFHRYEHGKDTKSAYLNTLFYSDWALGEFMNHASKQDWYENTVFVFVADHVLRASATELDTSFRIPLLIYTPDQSLPPSREVAYASQYDVLPTLVDLLGITQPVASFGRSLLKPDSDSRDGVVVQRGNMTGWLSPKGWFSFNRDSEQSAGGDYLQAELRQSMTNWLKWRLQLADQRLLKNEWLPNALEKPLDLVNQNK